MSRGPSTAVVARAAPTASTEVQPPAPLVSVDYEALAHFRYELRKFLAFSEAQAEAAGLLPQQYQAMVAIKGFAADGCLTMGELADRLCIRPHSCVELVDRMAAQGLAERLQDEGDKRRVRIKLTMQAEAQLASLAAAHVHLLCRIGPMLTKNLRSLKIGANARRRPRRSVGLKP